ncbi:DUF1835 domain-containing protein [Paenibacillus sp. Soil522]|uniref:DUF1835 domain-containing protein n=1 Tax=Paenibacillus sp. Soil522 TaxID=1736388 RepID=UPI0006F1F02D|nr:DUF1835 domain-containing protein [Paenibacillus sp. Soil522]KRE53603.1 RNA polymerase subunit sigma-24 [Paenibacillus sp. Soil522]
MLHIVNGDSVGTKLKKNGTPGDVLVWREIYTEGPVFTQPELPANRAVRGQYLEQALGIPRQEWRASSEAQEKQLSGFRQYNDIVLWFEHDLYDQTMLSCLLYYFSEQARGGTKLHLLSINQYPGIPIFHGLGQLSEEQLFGLVGTWQVITAEQLLLGKKAWEAFTSKTPEAIAELLQEDTSALPFLHAAFRLHLKRFPSVQNGLGIIEQTTIELLLSGVDTPLQLFQRTGDRLYGLGMGDIQYWLCLRRLSEGPHPLISLEGNVRIPGLNEPPEAFLHAKVSLTELGEKVAGNHADWTTMSGIDVWYGGVWLESSSPLWRWDASRSAIVRA